MKFSEVIKLVKNKITIKSSDLLSDGEFFDIALLDKSVTYYDNEILYIGHYAQLSYENMLPKHFIFFHDENDCSCRKLSNYIQIEEKNYAFVFNVIREELMRSLKAEQTYANMLRMILNGRGLEAILNGLAEKAGNAMVVLDISGKILAHSTPFNVPDPLWIQSVERGYCPIEFMEHIRQMRSRKDSPKTTEAFTSVCDSTNMSYLCSKILSKDFLLGYVFMFECDQSIDEQTRQLLPIISKATSELILRGKDSVSLRSQLYCNILVDMLEGINPSQARMRIQNSELHFPERMSVLYAKPSYYHGENYIKEELHKTLLTIFDKAPSVYYNKGIVLIIPVDDSYHIDESAMEELRLLAKEQHIKVGVSNAFNDPALFPNYYSQAEYAILFSQRLSKEDNINYYSDFAFFDILNKMPVEVHLGKFCHPALARLRGYDHEHGTELYNTLKVLTETGFNQRKTAELLFLHRNTLNYRKHRIEEVGGICFENEGLLFQLLYSFQIDGFLEGKNQ
ncbi:hypothetical protein GOM49_13605 [Clostridium bovifaecis]|uniref:PucR C-terminal helix-turn-helix domain-containing protein n=1 Tax=Clostridium bovifaecis TaxID=2184719 RepID=A0A6I6EYF1_9CLOT|nr:hypothetical protein GOM49_13605 [Clostridium bovifaecis]